MNHRACVAVVALVAACVAAPVPAALRPVDYLYIEANEGGSSGGHVALRFGAETFHFQQEAGGLLRLQRDDSAVFDVRYALLDNRPMHEQRITVSEDSYDRLHDAFTRLLFVQAAQFAHLQALSDDVALFELWGRVRSSVVGRWSSVEPSGAKQIADAQFVSDGHVTDSEPTTALRRPTTAFPIPAAGYFLPDGFPEAPAADGESPSLAALRARVVDRYGERFIADRLAAVRARLAAWRPRAVDTPAPPLARDVYPAFAPTASTEYTELLTGLTALEVLARAPRLRPDSYRVADQLPPLDERERAALARFATTLTAELAPLAASARADFGYPLLLGMARLAAMEATLASDHLVMLDAFGRDAVAVPLPSRSERGRYFAALAAELHPAIDRTRQTLFGESDFHEADYAHLETAVNRLLEVEDARRTDTPMRMERGLLAPARPALRAELVAAPLPATGLEAELHRARRAAAQYRARLAELYGYNLLARNCVSEIFDTIEAAFAGGASGGDSGEDMVRQRLGGVVRTRANFNFIPFVSADAVGRSYIITGSRDRPSYLQLRRDRLMGEEPPWQIVLRESNTLTSTIYHAGPQDSAFLFFTDDSVALRPLLGAANLLVGVGDGVLGLVTWPLDDGARLRAGWYGALFSLPELAFVNIRKGSMAWIEPVEDGRRSSVVGRWSDVQASTH